ncbi:hypothetical protein ACJ73_07104 [Blastomyces percursus]|uniref:Uncharacterized protein n=1 Tax=Blastomyces percursus TaxID=1658174 RepID=A0A1J9R1S0_9EURO|nr:hypothetical protein ACJ73_07104 [Blastomyces percursus]
MHRTDTRSHCIFDIPDLGNNGSGQSVAAIFNFFEKDVISITIPKSSDWAYWLHWHSTKEQQHTVPPCGTIKCISSGLTVSDSYPTIARGGIIDFIEGSDTDLDAFPKGRISWACLPGRHEEQDTVVKLRSNTALHRNTCSAYLD